MRRPAGTDGRDLALAALCDAKGHVTDHLNRLLASRPVGRTEAGFARELALGVVRRLAALDAIIAAFQRRTGAELPDRVWAVLRLGVYQLAVLDRVPEFAAVNESVNRISPRRRGLRGFVNALLRSVARSVSPLQAGPPPLAADVLPISHAAFRRFDRAVFPDPAADPAGYLAAAGSLPLALARRWLAAAGGLAGAMALALHAAARPPLVLRVNSLRASVAEVMERLAAAGIRALPHASGLSVVIADHVDLASLEVFAAGLVQPQDASATSVVAALDLRPGMRALDLCAAPGTKTTHLAERMGNQGEIVAADVSDAKLARIEANCRRLGVSIVRTIQAEAVPALIERPFDLVLVDAPCSNTGVLARRVEARWRFSAKAVAALAADQKRLLLLGSELVAPGGTLVYSTCSLEPEENRQVVEHVLARRPHFRLAADHAAAPAGADDPARWSDGGYCAVMRG